METPRLLSRLFTQFSEIAKSIAGKLRPKAEPPGMIGLPPSARGLTGRPAGPALHARAVAREWADVAEKYTQNRMLELGIPDHQIGAPDYRRGGEKHSFLPDEMTGGSNGTGRRLFVDSGVLNPELNADAIGPEASKVWSDSSLRDRIGSVIAHEHLEAQGFPHDEVVQRAPDTELPISDNARRILRSMAAGAKRAL